MFVMIDQSHAERYGVRLKQEVESEKLTYLSYLFVPAHGLEGVFFEVGQPDHSPRHVHVLASPTGRTELHWAGPPTYTAQHAAGLLSELGQPDRSVISDRLHATICQSLTAAHLHLELGLMTGTDVGEDFVLVRDLIREATHSVRQLMDDLAGEQP